MYNLFSFTLVYCTYQGVRNSLGLGWVGPRPLIFEKLALNLQKEVILIFQLHYSVLLQYSSVFRILILRAPSVNTIFPLRLLTAGAIKIWISRDVSTGATGATEVSHLNFQIP